MKTYLRWSTFWSLKKILPPFLILLFGTNFEKENFYKRTFANTLSYCDFIYLVNLYLRNCSITLTTSPNYNPFHYYSRRLAQSRIYEYQVCTSTYVNVFLFPNVGPFVSKDFLRNFFFSRNFLYFYIYSLRWIGSSLGRLVEFKLWHQIYSLVIR